jgi:hypothetical protein
MPWLADAVIELPETTAPRPATVLDVDAITDLA